MLAILLVIPKYVHLTPATEHLLIGQSVLSDWAPGVMRQMPYQRQTNITKDWR